MVDDDKNTGLLYKRELTDEGYEVSTAANACEALEQFRSDRPDLAVLDIRIPTMDGLEVLSRMLSIDRQAPIVLFSAYSFYQDKFLPSSADAFIPKSSDLSELKCAIRDRLLKRVPLPAIKPGTRSSPSLHLFSPDTASTAV